MREIYYTDGLLMPKKFEQIREDILNLKVNDEDIWITSFPKSGTTWSQEMIWMIHNNLDFEKGKIPLAIRSPFLEFSMLITRPYETTKELGDLSDIVNDSVGNIKKQKSPVFVKSHLPWQLLPRDIQSFRKRPKIIYIYRKPKDVCISAYYFFKSRGETKSLDQSFDDFLKGDVIYGPYWNHVLGFWEHRNESNILLIKYEDMKKNLPKVIRNVANFLGKELTDNQINVLSEHLTFENMKKNPAVQVSITNLLRKQVEADKCDSENFFRSGTSNQHKTEFSDNIIKRFDEWESENTKGTDFVL